MVLYYIILILSMIVTLPTSTLEISSYISTQLKSIVNELNNMEHVEAQYITTSDVIDVHIVKHDNIDTFNKYVLAIYFPVEDYGGPVFFDFVTIMIKIDKPFLERIFKTRVINDNVYVELRRYIWICWESYPSADENMFMSIIKKKMAFIHDCITPMPRGHFIAQLFGQN